MLRPLDFMQLYRLEIGSKLSAQCGDNLYDFWGSRLTEACTEVTASYGNPMVVSLASNGYLKAIRSQD